MNIYLTPINVDLIKEMNQAAEKTKELRDSMQPYFDLVEKLQKFTESFQEYKDKTEKLEKLKNEYAKTKASFEKNEFFKTAEKLAEKFNEVKTFRELFPKV